MAIANYLFARHYGGQFLIRIEDTDAARSDPSMVEPILSSLKWLGLDWDGEIIYQSQRLDFYRGKARQILESGAGYRCFCTPQQLEEDRERARKEKLPLQYNRRCLSMPAEKAESKVAAGDKYAIRIKIPEGDTTFADLVSGTLKRGNEEIEDFIIARSNGTATYNLAVVVDDHDMGITHVLRGNDHITNTFKQVHIYRALGYPLPVFGHVPLILRPDKRKVSKRLGDKDVGEYRKEGILPEAMFNFLCLLGWSPKTDREIYTAEELVRIFNPDNFNASNAVFDEEKLLAFNREHILRRSDHELATLVAPLLVDAGLTTKYWLETRWEYLRGVIGLLKERVRRLADFVSLGGYFFSFDYLYDADADRKTFTAEAAPALDELANRFEQLSEFTLENTEDTLRQMAEEKGVKRAALIHPTRLAVTGAPGGPGLYETLALLTKPIVIDRMRRAVTYIEKTKTRI
jgi:glutamyl-tRNA synthetase